MGGRSQREGREGCRMIVVCQWLFRFRIVISLQMGMGSYLGAVGRTRRRVDHIIQKEGQSLIRLVPIRRRAIMKVLD